MADVIGEKDSLLKSVMEKTFEGLDFALVSANSDEAAFPSIPTVYYGSQSECRINTIEESVPIPINVSSAFQAQAKQWDAINAADKDPLFIPLWKCFDRIRPDYLHRIAGRSDTPISIDEKTVMEQILSRVEGDFRRSGRMALVDRLQPWKEEILLRISSADHHDIKLSVFLLNHLLVGDLPDLKAESRDEKIWKDLQKGFLTKYAKEFNLEVKNSFFNVLLVDDFFFLHVYQFSLIERHTAGFSEDGKVCPVIHFDFECIPENVAARLDERRYDLVLLDIDFGKLKKGGFGPADVIKIAAAREIPVMMFSKYKYVENYKPFIGKLDGEIEKDEPYERIFQQIYKTLVDRYDTKKYQVAPWLIFKSRKLGRIGYFYNKQFTSDIAEPSLPDVMQQELKFGDSSELFVPDENSNWKFLFCGKKPKFVESLNSYYPAISKRLMDYKFTPNQPQRLPSGSLTVDDKEICYESFEIQLPTSHDQLVCLCSKSKVYHWEDRDTDPAAKGIIGIGMDLNYIVVPSFSGISLFDIIGPVTIGPSSSHTAGANRIARLARNFAKGLFKVGEPITRIKVEMLNSFTFTGKGHGSDYAIAAGLCGRVQYDPALPKSLKSETRDTKGSEQLSEPCIINGQSVDFGFLWPDEYDPRVHMNSIRFHFYRKGSEGDKADYVMTARSWGGGNVQITSLQRDDVFLKVRDQNGRETEVDFCGIEGEGHEKDIINTDRNFLSGKNIMKVRFGETDTLVEIEPVYISAIEQIDVGLSNPNIFIQEKSSDTDPVPLAQGPSRPPFLTLDDLERSEEELWTTAIDYEIWARYQNGQTVTESWIWNLLRQYRELMVESIECGLDISANRYSKYEGIWAAEEHAKAMLTSRWSSDSVLRAKTYATAVNEVNVRMNAPVVAAPTCGSCGVIPGVLKAMEEELGYEEGRSLKGLLIASLVGLVVNNLVPTAGATAGCQAELGTAAAMAAAMATFMLGGKNVAIIHAAALALKNSLGLVCDPLHGKVEVPCIKRAGMKAVEATQAAFSAYHGVTSTVSPWDVVGAMKEIGGNMNRIYKETSLGGLALTRASRSSALC